MSGGNQRVHAMKNPRLPFDHAGTPFEQESDHAIHNVVWTSTEDELCAALSIIQSLAVFIVTSQAHDHTSQLM